MGFGDGAPPAENDLVQVAAGLPPSFAPGARWSYSNTGYVLLGAIVRPATGRFYGDLLRERIFAPLGMRTARIISEADLIPNRSDGYRLAGDSVKHQDWVSPSLNTTADGSLYFTVRDLAAWATALDQGRALPGADRAQAWGPVRLNDGGSYPYGFGWMLAPVRGRPSMSHRLAAPLPGPRPPMPADFVVRALANDSSSARLTRGLQRFLSETSGASGRRSVPGSTAGRSWAATGPPARSSISALRSPGGATHGGTDRRVASRWCWDTATTGTSPRPMPTATDPAPPRHPRAARTAAASSRTPAWIPASEHRP